MDEEWRFVQVNDGILFSYQVSNYGNVRNSETRQLLKGYMKPEGYKVVDLYHKGKRRKLSVHRLVAKAFIPELDNSLTVNHKDADKMNNHVSNLEWVTQSENIKHALAMKKPRKPVMLTDREKQFIVNACDTEKLTRVDISTIFGISLRRISQIKNEWRKEKASDTPASKV